MTETRVARVTGIGALACVALSWLQFPLWARTIMWLAPYAGCFQVLFIFGEKALTAIRQTALPARVLRVLDEAPRYPEGTGVRFQITAAKDIGVVKTLAAIKLQH